MCKVKVLSLINRLLFPLTDGTLSHLLLSIMSPPSTLTNNSTSNLFVMDGHNNTTSLSNRMSHVVGRFRSICLSVWLDVISYHGSIGPLRYKAL